MTNKNKEAKLVATSVDEKDLEVWAKWSAMMDNGEDNAKLIEEMANRVVNITDMTSVANYLVDVSKADTMQYLNMMIERLSVMEYIITEKLGVTSEEMLSYSDRYHKELAEAMEQIKGNEETTKEEK